jgi:hypothetical protein
VSKSIEITKDPYNLVRILNYTSVRNIDVKYYYIWEERIKGVIRLWYCPTKDMAVDGLTKPLAGLNYKEFIRMLHLRTVNLLKDEDD